MNLEPTITDAQRAAFLLKLVTSELGVDDWEKRFLGSFMEAGHTARWFTDGRRKSAEAMWRKYGAELKHIFPMVSTRKPLPKADDDGCEFLVKLDGVQQPCNEPAAFVNRNQFRYCVKHEEQVQRDLRRRGAAMVVQPFTPKNL